VIAAEAVKRLGREAGFPLVRIGPAGELGEERDRYLAWIEAGRQGEMRWITPEHALRSSSPRSVLPGARSVISVALPYWGGLRPPNERLHGRIARYAWGRDYHAVLGERLQRFAAGLEERAGPDHRWYVDTGPVMDKALAVRSGLGWQGKNTNILTEEFGSFVLLGEILTTLPLEPDPPIQRDCGSCRLCVAACPTGALGPDYSIDSRTCISYLTIEHRGPIPRELRPAIGSWVFGCDICQDVCPPSVKPFLRSSTERRAWAADVRAAVRGDSQTLKKAGSFESVLPPAKPVGPLYERGVRPSVDLVWLLSISHEDYLDAFRGTAVRRAKVWMLRRNAAVALGNVGDESVVQAVAQSLAGDDNPLVRGHAAWALGEIAARTGNEEAVRVLKERGYREQEEAVLEEISSALAGAGRAPREAPLPTNIG
jgi:epoxyqueuosine reductase